MSASHGPREFVDIEHKDVATRKRRSTALEEANYAVASEIQNNMFEPMDATDYDRRVIQRAELFERYLESGAQAARVLIWNRRNIDPTEDPVTEESL